MLAGHDPAEQHQERDEPRREDDRDESRTGQQRRGVQPGVALDPEAEVAHGGLPVAFPHVVEVVGLVAEPPRLPAARDPGLGERQHDRLADALAQRPLGVGGRHELLAAVAIDAVGHVPAEAEELRGRAEIREDRADAPFRALRALQIIPVRERQLHRPQDLIAPDQRHDPRVQVEPLRTDFHPLESGGSAAGERGRIQPGLPELGRIAETERRHGLSRPVDEAKQAAGRVPDEGTVRPQHERQVRVLRARRLVEDRLEDRRLDEVVERALQQDLPLRGRALVALAGGQLDELAAPDLDALADGHEVHERGEERGPEDHGRPEPRPYPGKSPEQHERQQRRKRRQQVGEEIEPHADRAARRARSEQLAELRSVRVVGLHGRREEDRDRSEGDRRPSRKARRQCERESKQRVSGEQEGDTGQDEGALQRGDRTRRERIESSEQLRVRVARDVDDPRAVQRRERADEEGRRQGERDAEDRKPPSEAGERFLGPDHGAADLPHGERGRQRGEERFPRGAQDPVEAHRRVETGIEEPERIERLPGLPAVQPPAHADRQSGPDQEGDGTGRPRRRPGGGFGREPETDRREEADEKQQAYAHGPHPREPLAQHADARETGKRDATDGLAILREEGGRTGRPVAAQRELRGSGPDRPHLVRVAGRQLERHVGAHPGSSLQLAQDVLDLEEAVLQRELDAQRRLEHDEAEALPVLPEHGVDRLQEREDVPLADEDRLARGVRPAGERHRRRRRPPGPGARVAAPIVDRDPVAGAGREAIAEIEEHRMARDALERGLPGEQGPRVRVATDGADLLQRARPLGAKEAHDAVEALVERDRGQVGPAALEVLLVPPERGLGTDGREGEEQEQEIARAATGPERPPCQDAHDRERRQHSQVGSHARPSVNDRRCGFLRRSRRRSSFSAR